MVDTARKRMVRLPPAAYDPQLTLPRTPTVVRRLFTWRESTAVALPHLMASHRRRHWPSWRWADAEHRGAAPIGDLLGSMSTHTRSDRCLGRFLALLRRKRGARPVRWRPSPDVCTLWRHGASTLLLSTILRRRRRKQEWTGIYGVYELLAPFQNANKHF